MAYIHIKVYKNVQIFEMITKICSLTIFVYFLFSKVACLPVFFHEDEITQDLSLWPVKDGFSQVRVSGTGINSLREMYFWVDSSKQSQYPVVNKFQKVFQL